MQRFTPLSPVAYLVSTKELRALWPTMLRVVLKPSRYIAAVLIAAHCAAAVTLVPLDVQIAAKLAFAVSIAASFTHELWRHALLTSRYALVAIELRDDGRTAAVQTRRGEWHEARILGSTYVSSTLTVINLRLPGRIFARHVLIVPDNADPELFRQLRVWLRWRYSAALTSAG